MTKTAKKAAPARKTSAKAGQAPKKSAAAGGVRPCPRCDTTDRVEPAGGNPPMLVHMGCGYTFPVETDAVV